MLGRIPLNWKIIRAFTLKLSKAKNAIFKYLIPKKHTTTKVLMLKFLASRV